MVKLHYEAHLADVYAWMSGNFSTRVQEQQDIFARFGIVSGHGRVAIDLGCGHGLQAVALANLGFRVQAVDFSEKMLAQLRTNISGLRIEPIKADLAQYRFPDEKSDLNICMGDTLTHLGSNEQVEDVLLRMSDSLQPGGEILISFRDLSSDRENENRFILVKADDQRTLTCFLEYFPDKVMVYDLLTEKHDGKWSQRVSSYPKLRISGDQVANLLVRFGCASVRKEVVSGMTFVYGTAVNRQPT